MAWPPSLRDESLGRQRGLEGDGLEDVQRWHCSSGVESSPAQGEEARVNLEYLNECIAVVEGETDPVVMRREQVEQVRRRSGLEAFNEDVKLVLKQ